MAKAVVFDLDGVVYRGAHGIPGVAAEIARLQKKMPVLFLTNNATKSRMEYVRHLARFGITAEPKDVMTSAFGCAHYVLEKFGKGKKVFVIGEAGLRYELEGEAMAELVEEGAEIVVCGLDREISYARLDAGLKQLVAKAKFILANSDPTYPTENGVSPGSGAIAASLIYASGRKPDVVIGKPGEYLPRKLLEMHGVKPRDAIFVGDRLDIDIRVANKLGMKSVLVLSGIAKKSDLKRVKRGDRPKLVLESAAGLGKALKI
jgi:4-nitrophenyl phosphatase